MGRLSSGGATYTAWGALATFNGVTREYNTLGQLAHMTKAGVMDVTYGYTAGQNNGRITSSTDAVTGEVVSYQYDAVNRLIHAETADAAWGTTYAYDGWGNLTDKSLTKGSAPVMHTLYDPTLNMVAGSAAPSVVPQGYFSDYDVEDRPLNGNAGIWTGMSGRMTYDHSGKKVFWKAEVNPAPGGIQAYCELYFYGITGQKLARYKCTYDANDSENPNMFSLLLQDRTQHVGGGLTSSDGTGVTTDRLGSIRAKDNGERYTYYPYGEAKTESVAGGGMYAGLESPVRNYVATMGRFDRPDPLGLRGVRMGDPGSWNRFAYTGGDPVNLRDPAGLADCDAEDSGLGRPCPALADGGGASAVSREAYEQYVTQVNTHIVTPTVTFTSGGFSYEMTLPSFTVFSAFPVPTTQTVTVNSSSQEFVWSNVTFGNVVSASTGIPQWSVTATLSNTSGAVPQNALTGSIGGFGLFGVFGGSLNFNYIPDTNTFCVGLSAGVGTPGLSVSVGTLSSGPGTNVQDVIEGFSITVSGNLTPAAGGQATYSPGNGTAVGVSFGTPGVNLTAGGSVCFH